MFGDSTTMSEVRQLLAKQAASDTNDLTSLLGLEHLETTLLNSFRYLMNISHESATSDDAIDVIDDVEASGGVAEEERIYNEDEFKLEDELRKDVKTDPEKQVKNYDNDCVVLEMEPFTANENNNGDFYSNYYDCEEKESDEEMHLLQLPVQDLLHIFSFLDAQDITNISSTCRQCRSLCADQILWRQFLVKDALLWQQISHQSNPALYEAVNSDLTYKEIYMRCSPQFHRESSSFNLVKLPQLLWSFIPHKPPKVVMFGPGLESNTSTLVRKFLGSDTDVFKIHGMFPAQLPGSVGTGFNVSMNGKLDMRLITMYSGTKHDRENKMLGGQRADRNRLLQGVPAPQDPSQDGVKEIERVVEYEPTSTIKELCRSVDAFIFVVDASMELETSVEAQPELFALMDDRWTSQKCPLVILSCIPGPNTPRVPCVTVAKQLALHKLNRTWKMFDANVSDLSGVVEAVTWLVESTQGR